MNGTLLQVLLYNVIKFSNNGGIFYVTICAITYSQAITLKYA